MSERRQGGLPKLWSGLRFRPRETHWFESFVPREQVVYALEALARTGQVQLELAPNTSSSLDLSLLRETLSRFEQLERRYRDHFPPWDKIHYQFSATLEETAQEAIDAVREWCATDLCNRRALKNNQRELERLRLLHEFLKAMKCNPLLVECLGRPTEFLHKQVYCCLREHDRPDKVDSSVETQIEGDRHRFFIVTALPHVKGAIQVDCNACQPLAIPDWLRGDCQQQITRVETRLTQVMSKIQELQQQAATLQQDEAIQRALNNLERMRWLLDQAATLNTKRDNRLCHITGWTTAEQPEQLKAALAKAHVRSPLRFPSPPEGLSPPIRKVESRQSCPYQLFNDLIGTPQHGEIDPSFLLPVIVPLLFGFMFPDLGHGLILAVVGLLLRGHFPTVRFLLPCGLSSALFGLIFGTLFGFHDLLQPWWFIPMDSPVFTLALAVYLGFALIMLGMIFSGIEAYWQQRLPVWLAVDGAMMLFYVSLMVGFLWRPALVGVFLGLAWFTVGIGLTCQGRCLPALGSGLGRLLHGGMELALNTLSFMRVGAFALAHASLAGVVNSIALSSEDPLTLWIVMILGHSLTIAIEAFLVFIQTFRLLLFEFCLRFLQADGRLFRQLEHPLKVPHDTRRRAVE